MDRVEERRQIDRQRKHMIYAFMALSLVTATATFSQCASIRTLTGAVQGLRADIDTLKLAQDTEAKERQVRRKQFDEYREQLDARWDSRGIDLDLIKKRLDQLEQAKAGKK